MEKEKCAKCGKDITNEGTIYIEGKPFCVDCDMKALQKIIEEQEKYE